MTKLGTSNSSRVGNWDVYADARDILTKVKRVSQDFDAYVDARDIELN